MNQSHDDEHCRQRSGNTTLRTEDEFLAIGSRLQGFYQRGVWVSSLASEMVVEVAGDHVSGAVLGLGGIRKQARRLAPASEQEATREVSASRYTMQSERKIHESLLEGALVISGQETSCIDEELGGNVEFF